jgi:hypothetical protein
MGQLRTRAPRAGKRLDIHTSVFGNEINPKQYGADCDHLDRNVFSGSSLSSFGSSERGHRQGTNHHQAQAQRTVQCGFVSRLALEWRDYNLKKEECDK